MSYLVFEYNLLFTNNLCELIYIYLSWPDCVAWGDRLTLSPCALLDRWTWLGHRCFCCCIRAFVNLFGETIMHATVKLLYCVLRGFNTRHTKNLWILILELLSTNLLSTRTWVYLPLTFYVEFEVQSKRLVSKNVGVGKFAVLFVLEIQIEII